MATDLDRLWAGLEREHAWTERYGIREDLRQRYLRAGRRTPRDPHSLSAVAIRDTQGAIVGVKFRCPPGASWAPREGEEPGPPEKPKYKNARGSTMKGVVFLGGELRAAVEAARQAGREAPTVVLCAGEKDALVAASHLDPQRWAAISGCTGEGDVDAAVVEACRGLRVVVAYDADATGRRGAARLWRALEPVAAEVRVADVGGVGGGAP